VQTSGQVDKKCAMSVNMDTANLHCEKHPTLGETQTAYFPSAVYQHLTNEESQRLYQSHAPGALSSHAYGGVSSYIKRNRHFLTSAAWSCEGTI